jgi:membrane protein
MLAQFEVFDRAMALAGQAFAALLPLLIVVGSVLRADGRDVANSLIQRFELSGDAAATLRAAVAPPTDVQSATTVVGAILLVVAALAFTRALQRLYVRVWGLDTLGWRGSIWGVLWLAGFSAYWSLQPLVAELSSGPAATAIALASSAAMWLFTPWLLLARRVSWRRLLSQALLTTAGLTALGVAFVYYVPSTMATSARQFGFIGAAFVLLSCLFAAALVVVVAAVLGAGGARRSAR